MDNFRITDIQLATVHGRACKLFKAFERAGDAFVFAGQFAAPADTPDAGLPEWVQEYIAGYADDNSDDQLPDRG